MIRGKHKAGIFRPDLLGLATSQGDSTKVRFLDCVSWGGFCLGAREASARLHRYIAGRQIQIPVRDHSAFPWEGKEVLTTSYRFTGIVPSGKLCSSFTPAKSWIPMLHAVLEEEEKAAQNGDFQSVTPSEAMKQKSLAFSCHLDHHHPLTGDS